ncbi:MAG: hypothetical protein Q9163_005435 [Psora crenata]
MDFPWTPMALASAGGSIVLVQFTPTYSKHESHIQTFSLLFVFCVICIALYRVILYPYLFSPLRHLPSPPGGSFWNGHFKRISNEPSGVPQQDWINNVPNNGLIYYKTFLNEERLLLTSPQALAEVLTLQSYDFIKTPQLSSGLGRILGRGLVLVEGEEHKAQRKMLLPAFAFRHIKGLYPIFWSKSCKLVNNLMAEVQTQGIGSRQGLSSTSTIEISNWCSRATLDIIGVAGMGQDFNALDDPDTELNATYRRIFQPTRSAMILGFLSLLLPQWLVFAIPAYHNNNVLEASETIKKVCRQLIHQKREKLRSQEKRTDPDILSVAIESGGFSEEDLVNQLMTMLLAGHETTAAALTWAIYLLCKNPEVQSRLREEIHTHLPSTESGIQISAQIVEECQYLQAVCNETLRIYAPVALTLRQAAHDTTLQGLPISKGTKVIISIWAVNTSVALWGEDASRFNPERWMGPGRAGNGGAESNFASMTFLHGPRSCIGQGFAKAEFATVLAAIVGKFAMELEDEDKEVAVRSETKTPLQLTPSRMHLKEQPPCSPHIAEQARQFKLYRLLALPEQ